MNLPEFKNILSVFGEGRNTGKTVLACNIITKFSREHDIYAFKISPHKHSSHGNSELIYSEQDISVYEEKDRQSGKDSSRMLLAGAERSWFLEVPHEKVMSGLNHIFSLVGDNRLFVCESGFIREFIKPGVSFYVRNFDCQKVNTEKKSYIAMADRIVNFTQNSFDIDLDNLEIKENTWFFNDK
ncbi:MAG: hypothetical protein JW894_04680 [Bacteroidales bacterium]|nr:hypothetical protein [Bacteroidales bacterium]